ncbi:MAG TPA: hypothetical protein VFG66_12850 [Gemmatimonadales bacterium]|nr:hypothetical protein [Gemmatimonadales bacterium]
MNARPIHAAVAAAVLAFPSAGPALAQTAADSAASAATGVYPARPTAPDSGRPAGDSAGSVRSDSAGVRAVAGDGPRADTAVSTGPLVVNLSPPDTTLMRACAGAPAGSLAPGLLAVVFRAGTSGPEKVAAAKAVGGTLAGPTAAGGEEYVRLSADAPALTVVADRLIRADPVTRVSPAPCPPAAVEPVPETTPTAPAPARGAPTASDTAGVPDSTAPPVRGPFAAPPR